MARSMTGYGRSTGELDGDVFTVEVSGVNHRFFDTSIRLPNAWSALEGPIRDALKEIVARGKISVNVRRNRGPAGRPVIGYDAKVAEQYVKASRELAHIMNTTEAMSLDVLAQLEGVFYQEETEQDLDAVKIALLVALKAATEQFDTVRVSEGEALTKDVANRIDAMEAALTQIEAQIPELAAAIEERYRTRLAELNADVGIKEDRLAVELAFMAEKTDVHEEVVRLKSHFVHTRELLASADPIGRELNFLAQEIQREANTLGSKLRDIEVSREVLAIKSELEKLREQAQNIE